jgi:hypothetical protein
MSKELDTVRETCLVYKRTLLDRLDASPRSALDQYPLGGTRILCLS